MKDGSNPAGTTPVAGAYAHWRRCLRAASFVLEDHPKGVPERWMQQIWRHQRIQREGLQLADGIPLRVLHPGFLNREPGPDFRGAVLRFADQPAVTGEIEIDRERAGWQGHGHADNPAYSKVILHVVWRASTPTDGPPLFPLEPYLDAPLAELSTWLDFDAPQGMPAWVPGSCAAPLAHLGPVLTASLLEQAASVRLRRKAAQLAARARHVGWAGALWEGLMGGLGYKHNFWPMRRIAEITFPWIEAENRFVSSAVPLPPESRRVWEARLLGISGLLPSAIKGGAGREHLRTLWDDWWRERSTWEDQILPSRVWRMAGIRPANHPHRRLALAAAWVSKGGLADSLAAWLTSSPGSSDGFPELCALLIPGDQEKSFWSVHWTLQSAPSESPKPLLGHARLTDLAINVILPWLWARANAGDHRRWVAEVERRYFLWPMGEDNSVLRLARQRLLGRTSGKLPRTAAIQQGILQITRDFCDLAGALCTACKLPEFIRELNVQGDER